MNTQKQTKQQFIRKHAPGSNIDFLASDMSARSYDRVFNKNKTFVLMNDQNEENKCAQRHTHLVLLNGVQESDFSKKISLLCIGMHSLTDLRFNEKSRLVQYAFN
mgnify:CR=1 FL=1